MKTGFTIVARWLPVAAALLLSGYAPAHAGNPTGGEIRQAKVFSRTLQQDILFNVYLPAGYDAANASWRYPVIYLLHGRGDSMSAWTVIKADLDGMIATHEIPAAIAIMPDAPWNRRASYYIDSQFTGRAAPNDLPAGQPVETAFIDDLVPHVDATYRTRADRQGRVVAGFSMGGYGAMRLALAHPELFGAAIILSPAVYHPLPPKESSTREFGAFGNGSALFDESIYREKNYPTLLPHFQTKGLPLALFIAVGDDEYAAPALDEASHDLDFEAHALYNQVRRLPSITAQLRVVDGGHNWDTWRPTFIEGAQFVFRYLEATNRSARSPR